MGKVKIILVLIVLLIVGVFSYLLFGSYSEGERAGTLVKLSKKGYVFKTWEGELNTFMYVSDQAAASAAVNNLWDFSVHDKNPEVIQIMQDAMLNGHRIKLYYREKYFKFPWNGDTKYFVYKAEVVKK
ncbi:MAG TPA: hypothetical protein VNB90_11385 [Cytophagaceae bacterium]|jgi:hypothetical protein|nr:hypothetical protein [Cytophagaceae bacterium]